MPDHMFYIHQTSCISPQETFSGPNIGLLRESVDNRLKVIEPVYEGIPQNILRRMARAVRIGVGAALPLIQGKNAGVDGIIMGTANAGMEESIQFMRQITEYKEGVLAPGSFVQSTPNSIASQISLSSRNREYNATHVHRGLAFENALLDTAMLLKENPAGSYVVGGVDEIGAWNYNIDYLDGLYKKEPISSRDLYQADSAGSIAGEGAALFRVSNRPANALAEVRALSTLHSKNPEDVRERLEAFINEHLRPGEKIDLLLSGENGDNRLAPFFAGCERVVSEKVVGEEICVARFKHLCGEYPTASSFALWLTCYLLERQSIPGHMIKRSGGLREVGDGKGKSEGKEADDRKETGEGQETAYKNVLLYNNYRGVQHSFMLVTR